MKGIPPLSLSPVPHLRTRVISADEHLLLSRPSRPSPTRPSLTPLTWMAFIRLAFNASGLFNTLHVLINNFPASLLDVRNHY